MSSETKAAVALLKRTLTGLKYGPKASDAPAVPLTFDRVMENRPPTSTAPLFQLPVEILSGILECVDDETLPILALVNSDCRQLARSRQFSRLVLDYDDRSWNICMRLALESKQRSENKNYLTQRPSLGACIRHLIVTCSLTEFDHAAENPDFDWNLNTAPKSQQAEYRKRTNARFNASTFLYKPLVIGILANQYTCPYLERVQWNQMEIPDFCYDNLTTSNIKHFLMEDVIIRKAFRISRDKSWPLQSLRLGFRWEAPWETDHRVGPGPLCADILRLCAPTLQKLEWMHFHDHSSNSTAEPNFFGTDAEHILKFPKLRILGYSTGAYIPGHEPPEPSDLNALLHAPLVVLATDSCDTEIFRKRGLIPTLETFCFTGFKKAMGNALTFLRKNTQLKKISFVFPVAGGFFEIKLLPLLNKSFSFLTSLELPWDETWIPKSVLEAISTISTLEQLALSAGIFGGWRHQWAISHQTMRETLQPLTHLKRIAWSRDGYRDPYFEGDHSPTDVVERYYEDKIVDHGDFDDPDQAFLDLEGEREAQVFEEQHQERMLKEADEYPIVFPKLEWIYFGQTFMPIIREAGKPAKAAALLKNQRMDCRELLRHVFSLYQE